MPLSDEFCPAEDFVSHFVACVLAPELERLKAESGLGTEVRYHLHTKGESSKAIGPENAPWSARIIFRRTFNERRVLVQVQARPSKSHETGFTGFVMKGQLNPVDFPASFKKLSWTNEYHTHEYRNCDRQ